MLGYKPTKESSLIYERFTDRARRVVVLAQEGARLYKHSYIGTEHMLYGLISEGEGVGYKVLDNLGITIHTVDKLIMDLIGKGANSTSGHIPFTPNAKRTLEMALREALQLGHNYIGTEHILLGLCRTGSETFVGKNLGLDLSIIRHTVLQMLSTYTKAPSDQPKSNVQFPIPAQISDILLSIQKDIDNCGDPELALMLDCQKAVFLAGWQHELPELWSNYDVDPEYEQYLKLKEKFEK